MAHSAGLKLTSQGTLSVRSTMLPSSHNAVVEQDILLQGSAACVALQTLLQSTPSMQTTVLCRGTVVLHACCHR